MKIVKASEMFSKEKEEVESFHARQAQICALENRLVQQAKHKAKQKQKRESPSVDSARLAKWKNHRYFCERQFLDSRVKPKYRDDDLDWRRK